MAFNSAPPQAAIFDMDGVLVDSNPFHLQKWTDLLNAHAIPYDASDLPRQILGQRNDHAFRYFFGPNLPAAENKRLSEELEQIFRDNFGPHAIPLPGLSKLIVECHDSGVPLAVASSAMRKNIEFVVDALKFRPFFKFMISGDDVKQPKPHPEIYLETAKRLNAKPEWCVAFEDSFVGIEAVKAAGMKCVAIASTFPFEDLQSQTRADRIVKNFKDLHLADLRSLFNGQRA
ncbi:MAG: HAD family hydrolase [Terriglobia bacterium]